MVTILEIAVQGAKVKHLVFILSGECELSVRLHKSTTERNGRFRHGRKRRIAILGHGEICGEEVILRLEESKSSTTLVKDKTSFIDESHEEHGKAALIFSGESGNESSPTSQKDDDVRFSCTPLTVVNIIIPAFLDDAKHLTALYGQRRSGMTTQLQQSHFVPYWYLKTNSFPNVIAYSRPS